MENFDLEKWRTDEYDVVTRDGRKVRIVCTDRKSENRYNIVGLVDTDTGNNEGVCNFMIDGRYLINAKSEFDLMLVKKKWRPKDGELFYSIGIKTNENANLDFGKLGVIDYYCNYDNDDDFHNNMINQGNCFKTEAEAQEKLNAILKLLEK